MPCRSKYAGRNLSPHGGAASVAEDGSNVAMAKNSRTRCRQGEIGYGRTNEGWCDSVWALPVCLPLQGSCAWSRAGRATRSGSDCPERAAASPAVRRRPPSIIRRVRGHQSIFQPSDLVFCTFYVLKNTPNHAFRVCICGAFGPDGTVKNMKSDCDTCCDVRIMELLAVRKNLQCPWI